MSEGTARANGTPLVVGQEVPERDATLRLMAELWYEQVPDLEDPRLLSALQEVSAETQLADGSYRIPHVDVTMELEAGVAPLLTVVIPGSSLAQEGKTLPDVSQTWDWAGAETALQGCTGSVIVSELLANLFTPEQRVTGLTSVLSVLVAHTRPRAVFWPNSHRVTDPAQFDPESLDGVLNVRFFTVETEGGTEGEQASRVMDTLGLDLFELPDIQCHYRDYEPRDVAAMLYSTAVYVFSGGDVIDDGHTISGPRGDERFPCRHEPALVPPARTVLDVDLGEPYAAGRRDRS
jgi:hypothetical protein